MAQTLHSDVFDNGLTTITDNAGMTIVITAGVPATRQEAVDLHPTGKRVSSAIALPAADAILENGAAGGSRRARIVEKSGTVAASVTGQDLHIAIYDGTRLLVVNDETSDQALTLSNPITIPTFNITFNQPV